MGEEFNGTIQLLLGGKEITCYQTLPESIEYTPNEDLKLPFENREYTFTATINEVDWIKLKQMFEEIENAIISSIVEDRISIIKHNNKEYIMEWNDINEKRPVDGSRVLVCDTYYKRVIIAIYNENNESWDNEDEDFCYKLSRCPYWTELPKFKDIKS
jgi:hypothetical protein